MKQKRKDSFIYLFFLIAIILVGVPEDVCAQRERVVLQSSNLDIGSLSDANVTYVIKSDCDLKGKTLKLKVGTIIELDEGSIQNGILHLSADCQLRGIGSQRNRCENIELRVSGKNICVERIAISNDSGTAMRSFSDCSNLSVVDCYINSSTDNAVKVVADNINSVIEGVRFENCDFYFRRMGIEIQNHGNNSCRFNGLTISGCSFKMLPSPKYGYAISLSGYGRNVIISSNTIQETAVGVEIVGFSDVEITDNIMQDITGKAIVASNERKMSNITIAQNRISCPKAKIQMANTSTLLIMNNELRLMCLELGGCSRSLISDNTLYSYGHYSVMIDGSNKESRNNIVQNNTIEQFGDNWAVFRCYGKKATKNKFLKNKVIKANSKGVIYDQKNGAAKNILK